jgi:hypothetical protein
MANRTLCKKIKSMSLRHHSTLPQTAAYLSLENASRGLVRTARIGRN